MVYSCFIRGCHFVTQCRDGYAGDGEECELDPDFDAIPVKGLSCTLPNCSKVGSNYIEFQITEFCLMLTFTCQYSTIVVGGAVA